MVSFLALTSNMTTRERSRTAIAAASLRAAYQVFESGRVFSDPLALRILGIDDQHIRATEELQRSLRDIRFFVAARSRLAEDELRRAVETRQVGQLVILGAGLDTFGYRNPYGDRLKVFEVDHPATQAWKKKQLSKVGIEVPSTVTFVPVDFEHESLADCLRNAGFSREIRTYFMWLGVVPYLTQQSIKTTLSFIAGHPGGSEVIFDYGEPANATEPELREQYEELAKRAAAAGEPFLSYFLPEELRDQLLSLGFDHIEDLDIATIQTRLLGHDMTTSRGLGHVIFASLNVSQTTTS